MDLPRAISIADETFRTMDRLGLADALKAESLLGTGSRYFGLNDRPLASSKPVPSRIGHPAKSQFDQPVLEDLLWTKARDHEHIEFLAGAQVNAITQDANGVNVGFQSALGAGTVAASWLVGADGGRSFVREALGIDLVGSTQQERWIVIDLLNVPGTREPYAEFHGNGTRPYVLVPGIKGRLRLEFMLFDDEDADVMTSPAKILELSRPFHPRGGAGGCQAGRRLCRPPAHRAYLSFRPLLPDRRCRAPHAALLRAGAERRAARRTQSQLEAAGSAPRRRHGPPPVHLRIRTPHPCSQNGEGVAPDRGRRYGCGRTQDQRPGYRLPHGQPHSRSSPVSGVDAFHLTARLPQRRRHQGGTGR